LGISKVEIQSAFHKFDERSGLKGAVLDIVRFKGILYVGTTMGTFYLENDIMGFPRFKEIKDIETLTQTFLIFKDPTTKKEILLAGAQPGLFEINNNVAKEINFSNKGIDFYCWKLTQVNSNPPRVYVGMTGGLTYIDYKDGNWVSASYVLKNDIKDAIKYVKEDSKGFIWASTELNGILQIKDNGKTQELKRFGAKEGLLNSSNIELYNFGDSIVASTNSGLYLFDRSNNQFTPIDLFKGIDLSQGKGIHKIIETPKGYAFTRYKDVTYSWVETYNPESSNIISTPFKYLPNKWINAIWVDPDEILWFGIQKELYSFDPTVIRNYRFPYNALIRRVISKEDTILFNGTFYQEDLTNRDIVSLIQNPGQVGKLPYRFNRLVFEFSATFYEKEEDTQFSYFLEGSDESWSMWNKEAKATYTNLKEGSYTFKVKARNIYETESTIGEYKFSIAPPWYRTILAYIIYGLFFIAFVWLLVRWNTRRLIAEKEELEEIVKERTAEVVAQKDEIEIQNEKISIQNEEIKSSIHYASRIQSAILTPNEQIQKIFNEYFILFLPRDIVSGDFYWITKVGTKKICVVADCTGHGVPGGFMSMLGMSFISQIIGKGGDLHPGDILNQLRRSVINSLHQTVEIGSSKDGMDIAIYIIDEETNILEFSGANNPLVHIRDNELNHIKSDKMPIGIHMRANEPFTTQTLELKPGDCIYTFSDGYVDQFGGPDQRKFMIKNFKELLLAIHSLPMEEQRERLHKNLLDWHGDSPRIDDVVVMGVRI
jgi:serine phosphatase RsbU (regulator of sigma subunit)